jgi:small multidrug resistance pump
MAACLVSRYCREFVAVKAVVPHKIAGTLAKTAAKRATIQFLPSAMSRINPKIDRNWMRWVLIAAATYNLLWGLLAILFPSLPFQWIGIEPPNYPSLWQCIGMIVGVYGVGFAIAATDPIRHWPIVLVGFLGKLFGPIGFAWAVSRGELPWLAGLTILTNDLIWWLPFGLILLHAARDHTVAKHDVRQLNRVSA